MTALLLAGRSRRPLRSLLKDGSGVALIEFAFSMPLVLAIGLYGVETANLALMNLRVSQAALNLADNAARVGMLNANNREELREIDLNDVLIGAKLQGDSWQLTKRGRITLSSLEEFNSKQYIHWQRCIGLKSGADYESHYGTTAVDNGIGVKTYDRDKKRIDGTEIPGGMGPASSKVTAPADSGVMFVEINYEYEPIVSARWLPNGSTRIQYTASLIVRDHRIFDQIYNPNPTATRMTCEKFNET